MARTIDADAVLDRYYAEFDRQDICDGSQDRDWLMRCIEEAPILTQPNEPLTCEGCIYEHNEHENCNYCKRAPYLGDYYYCRPPEGEEEKP